MIGSTTKYNQTSGGFRINSIQVSRTARLNEEATINCNEDGTEVRMNCGQLPEEARIRRSKKKFKADIKRSRDYF